MTIKKILKGYDYAEEGYEEEQLADSSVLECRTIAQAEENIEEYLLDNNSYGIVTLYEVVFTPVARYRRATGIIKIKDA